MKRGWIILFLFLFLVMPFISAFDLAYELDRVAISTSPFVGWLIGDIYDGELLLIKFLVFLVFLALVNFSLKRSPLGEDTKVVAIISIVVALIGVRYLTTEALINFIWLPYGGLALLMASILPFIIFFFFVEGFDEPLIRKVGWVAFICIYFGLAYYKWDDFSNGSWNLAWIYVAIAVISLLILLFEKSLRRMALISAIRRGEDASSIVLKTKLQKELEKINDSLGSTHLTKREAEKLQKEKSRIVKAIARIKS